jgi:NAD(P)-dependent dehydrogenase (short-subunit alcohol dehydrogenase family)
MTNSRNIDERCAMIATEEISPALHGRKVLVLGTGPNLGSRIALDIARAGGMVACVDISRNHAQRVAEQIRHEGGQAMDFECDITDAGRLADVLDRFIEKFGGVDGLVTTSATITPKGLMDIEYAAWRRDIEIALHGTFIGMQLVAKQMIKAGVGGSIVNVSSTSGHRADPGKIAYSTAKAGVMNLTRSAAVELAPHGIRVNSISPTTIDSTEAETRAVAWGESAQEWADLRARQKDAHQRVPIGRLPTPAECSAAAIFLMSHAASAITGVDLPVDGGLLAVYR